MSTVTRAGFVSGGVVMRIVEVRRYDHVKGRVLVVCSPDVTPRWVNLTKPRVYGRSSR